MAKKFFNQKVYNRKRKDIIQLSIIGVSIIGIVASIFLISYFKSRPKKEYFVKLQDKVNLEIGSSKPNNVIFIKELKGVNQSDIKVDYSKVNFEKLGTYTVSLKINNKKYKTKLQIDDYTAPILSLKELTIEKEEKYSANNFVDSCSDNSKADCIIEFYKDSINENGEKIDYANYDKLGSYEIKIVAKDPSNNEVIKTTRLHITKKDKVPVINTKPVTCEYGSLEYDTSLVLTNNVGVNDCALDINSYNDEGLRKGINTIANTETKKIQMELNMLPNLPENMTINRLVNAILNIEGDGFVGYSLFIEVKDNKDTVIVSYYLDINGNRIFRENPYKIK